MSNDQEIIDLHAETGRILEHAEAVLVELGVHEARMRSLVKDLREGSVVSLRRKVTPPKG